jgi:hypothetical protein
MIRALTVIGHGVDLLPHYISHYEKIVDEINIVVYENDLHRDLVNKINTIIDGNDGVKIVKTLYDRVFDWEKVTQLYNYVKKDHPNDWWVIADIDEFHLYPDNSLSDLITVCEKNNWDLVRGGFIDRVGPDGTFPEITQNNTLWEQFPTAGFFRYPMSDACPNKVCVMKGYIEITNGQHYAKINGQTTWRWQGWSHPLIAPFEEYSVQVHHFKWDESCFERIRNVAMINQDYAYSNEYRKLYKELSKTRMILDLEDKDYMFEQGLKGPDYYAYKQWNKLIKKIVSI